MENNVQTEEDLIPQKEISIINYLEFGVYSEAENIIRADLCLFLEEAANAYQALIEGKEPTISPNAINKLSAHLNYTEKWVLKYYLLNYKKFSPSYREKVLFILNHRLFHINVYQKIYTVFFTTEYGEIKKRPDYAIGINTFSNNPIYEQLISDLIEEDETIAINLLRKVASKYVLSNAYKAYKNKDAAALFDIFSQNNIDLAPIEEYYNQLENFHFIAYTIRNSAQKCTSAVDYHDRLINNFSRYSIAKDPSDGSGLNDEFTNQLRCLYERLDQERAKIDSDTEDPNYTYEDYITNSFEILYEIEKISNDYTMRQYRLLLDSFIHSDRNKMHPDELKEFEAIIYQPRFKWIYDEELRKYELEKESQSKVIDYIFSPTLSREVIDGISKYIIEHLQKDNSTRAKAAIMLALIPDYYYSQAESLEAGLVICKLYNDLCDFVNSKDVGLQYIKDTKGGSGKGKGFGNEINAYFGKREKLSMSTMKKHDKIHAMVKTIKQDLKEIEARICSELQKL